MKNTYGISTPKTVEQFRENLKKYDMTQVVDGKLHICVDIIMNGIEIDTLESITDLYKICRDLGLRETPAITPKIHLKLDFDDWFNSEKLRTTGWWKPCFWEDENNFIIVESQNDWFIKNYKFQFGSKKGKKSTCNWYSLDNQILRDFYIMTLGDFSGYELSNEEK